MIASACVPVSGGTPPGRGSSASRGGGGIAAPAAAPCGLGGRARRREPGRARGLRGHRAGLAGSAGRAAIWPGRTPRAVSPGSTPGRGPPAAGRPAMFARSAARARLMLLAAGSPGCTGRLTRPAAPPDWGSSWIGGRVIPDAAAAAAGEGSFVLHEGERIPGVAVGGTRMAQTNARQRRGPGRPAPRAIRPGRRDGERPGRPWPTVKVAVAALVIEGARRTVRVKGWVAAGLALFEAVIVTGYMPAMPPPVFPPGPPCRPRCR